MKIEFASLYDMMQAIPDEKAAIAYFRSVRWKNGEFCPYCGTTKIYEFSASNTFKCAECKKRFSLRVGTIFEGTKIEMRKWLMAVWLITSHRKGISSAQLARDLNVTQKSAWFMLHRLRHAARTRSFNRQLSGTIEADETFIGGKERNKHAKDRKGHRGHQGKTAVMGMLERGGELRAMQVDDLGAANLSAIVSEHIKPRATVITDEWPGYKHTGRKYRHETVNHVSGEYVRDGKFHTNSIEGFWSQFKRQVYGVHHWISKKHLAKYIDEAVWRFNRRIVEEAPRLAEFLGRVDGRLKYTALIAKT